MSDIGGQDALSRAAPPLAAVTTGASGGPTAELLQSLSSIVLLLYAFAARRETADSLCRAIAGSLDIPGVAICRLSANGDRDRVMGASRPLASVAARNLLTTIRAVSQNPRAATEGGTGLAPHGAPAHLRLAAGDIGGCEYYLAMDASDRYDAVVIEVLLDQLQPHLEQAISIRDAMDEFRARILLDVAVLDRAPSGFIVMELDGRVAFANAEGWHILDARDGIAVTGEQLVTTGEPLRLALDGALADLRATDSPAAIDCRSLQLPRPSGAPPYVVTLLPAIVAGDDTFLLPRRRLLMVITPSVPTRLPGLDYLQRTFGMTPAEARVCRLLATGQELDEVASQLSISVTTVKTHLMKIYQKLHINSRTQLLGRLQGHFWTAEAIVVNVDSDGPLLAMRSR